VRLTVVVFRYAVGSDVVAKAHMDQAWRYTRRGDGDELDRRPVNPRSIS